ncbi:FAD-dependent oxidoreductase [Cytobacillus sp. FSL K6-0265]|uniref:FAD-dependent oxidoreductase n=1 Tax=Cytobacillus sp. FSL K6-0265 TaxID=2921448 RepID=UPI0030F708EF
MCYYLNTLTTMLSIIKNGLPIIKKRKKKILTAVAGMAGLVSASRLKQAGHTVRNSRVGGRIYTLRSSFYGWG